MSDVIHLLSDKIANQIAAGEVVQRPASVVKELIENAVDSGASKITVIVKDAGKELIQVVDNGVGMSETDARMSLERHATSKISSAEDLFKIKTMGFRGEALASIAAVSQMVLKSRLSDRELGTKIEVEGSSVKAQGPEACLPGSSVTVRNLFFNIPARRNFLKSNGVEMRHIVDEFQRVALAFPDISFSFFQNDLESFALPEGKIGHRIVHLFGKTYQENLAVVNEETESLKIRGYVGKPEAAKKTRGEQFLFVNQRFIKSNYLNHAVQSAYEELIPRGYFPFYVLFVSIDPSRIDVNVHPTKTEIKFEDERMVYGVVKSAVRQALGAHNISPSLDFDLDVNFGKSRTISPIDMMGLQGMTDRHYAQFRNVAGNQSDDKEIQRLKDLYDRALGDDQPGKMEINREAGQTGRQLSGDEIELRFESQANDNLPDDQLNDATGHDGFVLQFHKKYIVTQVKSGMLMVDISRAHERILFDKFMAGLESSRASTQKSLFPQTVNFSTGDFALLQDAGDEIRALGFDFEDFGGNTVIIHGIPAELAPIDEKALFEGLVEQYKINCQELSVPKKDKLARALAKRSAMKPGVSLNKEEMFALIDSLFGSKNPGYSPDGRRTYFILDLNKIDQLFS